MERVGSDTPGINDETMQLVRLDEALRWLAEADTVEQVKAVVDLAETMRGLALRVGLGLQAQNRAAEIKLLGQRKGGALIPENNPASRWPARRTTRKPLTRFSAADISGSGPY